MAKKKVAKKKAPAKKKIRADYKGQTIRRVVLLTKADATMLTAKAKKKGVSECEVLRKGLHAVR